jgi:hypothetical protein
MLEIEAHMALASLVWLQQEQTIQQTFVESLEDGIPNAVRALWLCVFLK